MNPAKVKMGIVGVDGVAQITHLPILKKMKNVEVVAICDSDLECANQVANKFSISHVYTDIKDMLQYSEIDIVDICNSVQTHLPSALAALETGKHIMIEKPFAKNSVEANMIVDMARKYQRKVMAMMNLRFRPDAIVLKSILDNHKLGDIFYIKSGWLRRNEKWHQRHSLAQNEGGAIMQLGFQLIDLGLWLLGNPEVRSVKAVQFSNVMKLENEDSAIVIIHLVNNTTFTVEIGWNMKFGKDFLYLNLIGDKGAARLNPLTILNEQNHQLIDIAPSRGILKGKPYLRSYENEFSHFIFCILNDQKIQSSGDEIIEGFKIIDAIHQSVKSGKEVEML